MTRSIKDTGVIPRKNFSFGRRKMVRRKNLKEGYFKLVNFSLYSVVINKMFMTTEERNVYSHKHSFETSIIPIFLILFTLYRLIFGG